MPYYIQTIRQSLADNGGVYTFDFSACGGQGISNALIGMSYFDLRFSDSSQKVERIAITQLTPTSGTSGLKICVKPSVTLEGSGSLDHKDSSLHLCCLVAVDMFGAEAQVAEAASNTIGGFTVLNDGESMSSGTCSASSVSFATADRVEPTLGGFDIKMSSAAEIIRFKAAIGLYGTPDQCFGVGYGMLGSDSKFQDSTAITGSAIGRDAYNNALNLVSTGNQQTTASKPFTVGSGYSQIGVFLQSCTVSYDDVHHLTRIASGAADYHLSGNQAQLTQGIASLMTGGTAQQDDYVSYATAVIVAI